MSRKRSGTGRLRGWLELTGKAMGGIIARVSEDRIIEYPHAALRKKAQPVRRITDATQDLIATMIRLLRERGGLGLAANQVGVLERVIVVQREEGIVPLINPAITGHDGEEISDEGCLSLPQLYGMVPRHTSVTVRGKDPSGKSVTISAEGLEARALQHEIDHLDGILFTHRAHADSFFWLVEGENGETAHQPTRLEDALKVFELRNLARV
jgi:peptide deformylase